MPDPEPTDHAAELSPLAREMIKSLEELRDHLRSGRPIEERFKVTTVAKPEGVTMAMFRTDKVKLALSLISGRLKAEAINTEQCETLGFDAASFSYHGRPDEAEILAMAEEIICEKLHPRTPRK